MSTLWCAHPRVRFMDIPDTNYVHLSIDPFVYKNNQMSMAIHMLTETPGEIVLLALVETTCENYKKNVATLMQHVYTAMPWMKPLTMVPWIIDAGSQYNAALVLNVLQQCVPQLDTGDKKCYTKDSWDRTSLEHLYQEVQIVVHKDAYIPDMTLLASPVQTARFMKDAVRALAFGIRASLAYAKKNDHLDTISNVIPLTRRAEISMDIINHTVGLVIHMLTETKSHLVLAMASFPVEELALHVKRIIQFLYTSAEWTSAITFVPVFTQKHDTMEHKLYEVLSEQVIKLAWPKTLVPDPTKVRRKIPQFHKIAYVTDTSLMTTLPVHAPTTWALTYAIQGSI